MFGKVINYITLFVFLAILCVFDYIVAGGIARVFRITGNALLPLLLVGPLIAGSFLLYKIGFRFTHPRRLLPFLSCQLEALLLPVFFSLTMILLSIGSQYTIYHLFRSFLPDNIDIFYDVWQIFAVVSVPIVVLLAYWLGFRVSFDREEMQESSKPKRASRVDELFANLSDAEIRELRHPLISEAEDSNVISEDEWYEEKSKRRLQSER